MTYRDAARRALATFVVGASAAPMTAAVFDIGALKAAAISGLVAVWNLAARAAQAWLEQHPT